MASFRVIAGDFGEGKSGQVLVGPLYRKSARGFNMPNGDHIGTGQIETVEIATEENIKKIGGTLGWGLIGGLALGPVGLVAGALVGGRRKEITFVCTFKDGRRLLGSCDAKVFADIKAAEISDSVPRVERSSLTEKLTTFPKTLHKPPLNDTNGKSTSVVWINSHRKLFGAAIGLILGVIIVIFLALFNL